MSKRPPVINYVQTLWIADSEGQYAAYIDRALRHNVWWISILVNPAYRKRGYALLLARQAIQQWGHDELWVRVSGFRDQPFSDEQLAKIYQRFGFEATNVPGTMRRPPNKS